MKHAKANAAFSLVELLIVMVVLGIILTISIDAIVSARTSSRFRDGTSQIVDLIQTARSKSLSNLELNLSTGDYIADAFYVRVDTTTNPIEISLYADLTSVGQPDELLDVIFIHEDIEVFIDPTLATSVVDIIYTPPLGEVSFDPSPTSGVLEFTIQTFNGVSTQVITIDELNGIPELLN